MNIVVCVKQVVDTEAVIALDGAGEVELMGQTMVIDPYSEFAVERAVQLKEELGGTVTLLTLGSQDCLAAVRHGLAMGADAAVLIEDEQWTARDAAQAAALLAEAASTMGADLVMGGWKSGDTAAAQVMGRMAAIMRLPLANMATGLSVEGGTIVAECEVDDGVETARLPLPAVVAAQQGLAEPRYPSAFEHHGRLRTEQGRFFGAEAAGRVFGRCQYTASSVYCLMLVWVTAEVAS